MRYIKQILKEFCICFVIAVLLSVGLLPYMFYLDTKDCLCTVLTDQEETHQYDDCLERVIDPQTLNPGTFTIYSTCCEHGVRMRVIIDCDKRTYRGCLLDN